MNETGNMLKINSESVVSWRGRRLVVVILSTLVLLAACGSDRQGRDDVRETGSDEVATRDINAVLADHDDELMELDGVVGVAVGELDDRTPCLLIMLAEENASTRQKIPARIEGHPTKIVVSGEIKPLQDD